MAAIVGAVPLALFDTKLGVLLALVLALCHVLLPVDECRLVSGGQGRPGGGRGVSRSSGRGGCCVG